MKNAEKIKSCSNCKYRLSYLKDWEEKIYEVLNYGCNLDKVFHEATYCCSKYQSDNE